MSGLSEILMDLFGLGVKEEAGVAAKAAPKLGVVANDGTRQGQRPYVPRGKEKFLWDPSGLNPYANKKMNSWLLGGGDYRFRTNWGEDMTFPGNQNLTDNAPLPGESLGVDTPPGDLPDAFTGGMYEQKPFEPKLSDRYTDKDIDRLLGIQHYEEYDPHVIKDRDELHMYYNPVESKITPEDSFSIPDINDPRLKEPLAPEGIPIDLDRNTPWKPHENSYATQTLMDLYGLKGVSASSNEGYRQLMTGLNDLSVALNLPRTTNAEELGAIGSNRLTIIKDMKLAQPSYGGQFFPDINGAKVMALPADIMGEGGLKVNTAMGHEWWHYLDNMMQEEFGASKLFASDDSSASVLSQARPEVRQAWNELMDLLRRSNSMYSYTSRKAGDPGYYDSVIEKGARGFEDWLAHKKGSLSTLHDAPEDYKNNYTYPSGAVGHIEDSLNKDQLIGRTDPNHTPNEFENWHLARAKSERDKLFAAYDKLFATLQPEEVTDALGNKYWRLGALAGLGLGTGAAALSSSAQADPYDTKLSPEDEKKFQEWLKTSGQDGTTDYDLRGWWKENGSVAHEGHFTDKYKKPNHPTFSNESQYSSQEHPGGQWSQTADGKWAFRPSASNLENMPLAELNKYFEHVEPGNVVDASPRKDLIDSQNFLDPMAPDYIEKWMKQNYGYSTQTMMQESSDLLNRAEGFTTEGYVPVPHLAPHAGTTIGEGVDLGQMNVDYLSRIGVPQEIIEKVKPYIGKQGQTAVSFLKNNPLVLSSDEARTLSDHVITDATKQVRDSFNSDSIIDFDGMPKQAKDVLVSVAYQYGLSGAKSKSAFWRAMVTGNFEAAAAALRSFGDPYKKRREMEAKLLESIYGGN